MAWNATDIADLMNWCGAILIVLIIAVCYTVIRVKRGYPPADDDSEAYSENNIHTLYKSEDEKAT